MSKTPSVTVGPAADPRPASVTRAVVQFVVAGLIAVAVFVVGTFFVIRDLGRRDALRNARQYATLAGQGIVEPALDRGALAGDPKGRARIDRIVQERVLNEGVVRVKIWDDGGRIVYSDEPRLIGARYELGSDEMETLRKGDAKADLSDLSRPENRFERQFGPLYEVYTRIRAPDGAPLLFETYQRSSALVSSGRQIWRPFAFTLLGSLLLLWLIQVPLAWRLARRLQRSQLERERLLVHALEASADERRRIAADLHDGVVQDLAGMSFSLEAAAQDRLEPPPPGLRAALLDSAATTRASIRQLRTLLVEIHPPNLHSAGLGAALRDLLAPLTARGITTHLELEGPLDLGRDTELLVFRAAGEAIRNVQHHSEARNVTVRLDSTAETVLLQVEDDGVGFTAAGRAQREAEGHVGLTLLGSVAARSGGTLEVESEPGAGTRFRLEAPRG